MNSISSVIGRVPNLLSSQMMVGSINRSNSQLLQLQMQLASGRAVNRASENPVAAGTITVLDDLVERREQRVRNLSEAGSSRDAHQQDSAWVMEVRLVGAPSLRVRSIDRNAPLEELRGWATALDLYCTPPVRD